VQRAERQLTGELGESVHPIGVVRRSGQTLGQVERLARVRLEIQRIDAPGGCVDDLLDVRLDRLAEQQGIERQVRGAGVLMQVHVPTTAVVGSQVEHQIDPGRGSLCHVVVEEVSVDELDCAAVDV
jgi:hypothetical protein